MQCLNLFNPERDFVDPRIRLYEDPLFRALVVADILSHIDSVELFLEEPYRLINRMSSSVGHFRSNHLGNAASMLLNNRDYLVRAYDIRLPRFANIEDLFSELKPPFSNATFFDIACSLYLTGFVEETPDEIMAYAQGIQDEFEDWVVGIIEGKKKDMRLVDSHGNPLFGISFFRDIDLLDFEGNDESCLAGLIWGLYVMDSDFYRARAADRLGFDIGFGKTVPISLPNLFSSPIDCELADLLLLSSLETGDVVGLKENPPLSELREFFYESVLPRLVDLGIVIDRDTVQDENTTSGYVRIHGYKGSGTSDISAFCAAWLMAGPRAALALELADAQDTLQVLAKELRFGGQDESLIERLRKRYTYFDEMVGKYTDERYTDPLILFAYEDPTLKFFLPSCSQSYQWRNVYPESFPKTPFGKRLSATLSREIWFLKNFAQQYSTGSISRRLPRWPVGFERANSKMIFDYFIKQAHRFVDNRIFPPESWIYSHM